MLMTQIDHCTELINWLEQRIQHHRDNGVEERRLTLMNEDLSRLKEIRGRFAALADLERIDKKNE